MLINYANIKNVSFHLSDGGVQPSLFGFYNFDDTQLYAGNCVIIDFY